MDNPLVPPEAKAMIGKETEPQTFEVTMGHIRRFARAIGDDSPLYYDEEYARQTKWRGIIAPPLFVFSFVYEEPTARELLEDGTPSYSALDIPMPVNRVMGGGSDIELGEPVRPGDIITVNKKIADVYAREGRSGILYFTVMEITYTNQKGQFVAREKSTLIRR